MHCILLLCYGSDYHVYEGSRRLHEAVMDERVRLTRGGRRFQRRRRMRPAANEEKEVLQLQQVHGAMWTVWSEERARLGLGKGVDGRKEAIDVLEGSSRNAKLLPIRWPSNKKLFKN